MKILAKLPARYIEGADEVREGIVCETASGNHVRVWAALTYNSASKQTRIAFFTEWRSIVTPDDEAELIDFTNSLMGKSPEMIVDCGRVDPTTDPGNVEWLRNGKLPAPKKVN